MSATSTIPSIGDCLANGAVVLAAGAFCPRAPGLNPTVVVLALSHDEFVTWVVGTDDREAFWGHYLGADLRAALADFDERVKARGF